MHPGARTIIECLAKDPGARPGSAAVVSERLAATVPADGWTPEDAQTWWERHQPLTRFRVTIAGEAVEDRRIADLDLP